MFRPRRILAFLLLVSLPPAAVAQQDEPQPPQQEAQQVPQQQQPEAPERVPTLGEVKAKQQAAALLEIAGKQVIDAKSVSEVIQLKLKDKDLFVETSLKPTDEAIVRAPGLKGLSRVRINTFGGVPGIDSPPMTQFYFENVDYSSPEAIAVHTSVSQIPGQLLISQDRDRLDDETHTVQLIQNLREIGEGDNRVSLYVQITAQPEVNLRLGADSVLDLRRQHPAEMAKYVDPIFRTLRQEDLLAQVDPKLAWQVFADAFTASPELLEKLEPIIVALDAPSYQDREAATRQLEQLGQPAALALMKRDRAGLSDEQLSRIDAFVAQYKMVDDTTAAERRSNPDFLLDCLYSEDEAIRRLALEELKQLTGREIEFDLSADHDQRAESIRRLRDTVGAVPTTQSKAQATE